MPKLLRRHTDRLTHRAAGVMFCESCAQVCPAACRSTARIDHIRTEALTSLPALR
jgi:succinate dehydrogenase/fumarate reductase-like Fe-S protein